MNEIISETARALVLAIVLMIISIAAVFIIKAILAAFTGGQLLAAFALYVLFWR